MRNSIVRYRSNRYSIFWLAALLPSTSGKSVLVQQLDYFTCSSIVTGRRNPCVMLMFFLGAQETATMTVP